jgi:asparagine synthase (glutamine-hydrolysing)
MCGICGIIHDDPSRPVDREVLRSMNRTLLHRGPDDEGYYLGHGVGIAMRRLAIIDVQGGQQPMCSEDGEVIAVCNGEIYNFLQLRKELQEKGHTFRTGADTEILPHLYQEYGADALSKLNGMFGLCIWNQKERTLLLARDRMGQKPLYWTHQGGRFIFGSELKAILAHPSIEARPDRASISKYLAYEYVPAPRTIFEGIYKLEPGQYLLFKNGQINVKRYWDVPMGQEHSHISEQDAAARLLEHLERSVRLRLMSDVPLGVFLSGGIDSSTMVAVMSRLMPAARIKTFSIAFAERSFDESDYARRVAGHFGTDHRQWVCTPADLLKLFPQVVDCLDEPLGDASIIPTYALSRFTREHVAVALGGDGGDELFAGYPTFQAEIYAKHYRRLPSWLRGRVLEPVARRLPASDRNISLDFRVKQFLKGATVPDSTRHMIWMGSFAPQEQRELLAFDVPAGTFDEVYEHERASREASDGNRLLYIYKKLYLAEDILTKVDRASMGLSLETRAPFLDHELVEFVARLPYGLKLRGLTMKHLLKKAVGPMLPRGIASRPKKGFGIPVARWIKGPLKELALDSLSPQKISREGFFNPLAISRLVEDHLAGRADNRKKLWTVLMFEQWLERWGSRPGLQ